jgi:hypothetical protein
MPLDTDIARATISHITVNRIMTLNSDMEQAFQNLRKNGCTVRYESRINRLFSIDYYGIEIEGPIGVLNNFKRWLDAQ